MQGLTPEDATRVIGVYAYSRPGKVFLYEDACIVAGSEELIRKYFGSLAKESGTTMKISKLRFGEIFESLRTGAAYAFDKPAYARFYSLARRAGIDDLEGFRDNDNDDFRLMKIRFNQAS